MGMIRKFICNNGTKQSVHWGKKREHLAGSDDNLSSYSV